MTPKLPRLILAALLASCFAFRASFPGKMPHLPA